MSQGVPTDGHQPGLESSIAQIVNTKIDELALCPDGWFYPNEDFNDDVCEVVFPILKRLARGRAVKTKVVDDGHDSRWERHREYRLTDHTREVIQETLKQREAMMPCGHAGLNNRGDHFECSFALCDREATREELNA